MIGIVVVSHSPKLAHAAVDLATQMAETNTPPIRVAAGVNDQIGTDATAIARALDEVSSPEGVLVLMDLGSAILSTEMALELRESDTPVHLSSGPFVEGLMSAVVLASTGADLATVVAESSRALDAKKAQLGDTSDELTPTESAENESKTDVSFEATISNPSGLHARPAATFVKTISSYDATVHLTLLDSHKAAVNGASLVALMALGVTQGSRVRVDATGPDATAVATALREQIDDGFGEK